MKPRSDKEQYYCRICREDKVLEDDFHEIEYDTSDGEHVGVCKLCAVANP